MSERGEAMEMAVDRIEELSAEAGRLRELLEALVDALRPLLDPDICSPFISALEIDTNHGADGEEIHARLKALVQQIDASGSTDG